MTESTLMDPAFARVFFALVIFTCAFLLGKLSDRAGLSSSVQHNLELLRTLKAEREKVERRDNLLKADEEQLETLRKLLKASHDREEACEGALLESFEEVTRLAEALNLATDALKKSVPHPEERADGQEDPEAQARP